MNTKNFSKILVANRGEIACRIIRSIKKMGKTSVAIYSEADENALFTQLADEAYLIGKADSADSYLNIEKIISICKEHHVDAVHPGYGFLSENSNFAKALTNNGITLIGPSPEAMDLMGSKLAAKETVAKYDVPMVPGTEGAVENPDLASKIADEIGLPILIKASAGGGGKGMRVVYEKSEVKEQFERAVSEAISAFGDGQVFIEKFVEEPRHIEIQILADRHGNVVYLNERECSIQRRHQKVIEEAPSPVITPELRKQMGEAACNVARSCDYEGAGTVEFLYDSGNFYFLEMNTRLQVEHPVTEYITGVDLVEEQIKIAQGEEMKIRQEDVKIDGHAIEVRVYAEDPFNNFLPDIGKLIKYKEPKGIGIRVDSGFVEGDTIPLQYDPMIAKLIVHAKDRNSAIEKMTHAINNYKIIGISTTLGFCEFAINHEDFVSGNFSTNFVKKNFENPEVMYDSNPDIMLAGAIKTFLNKEEELQNIETASISPQGVSEWTSRK
ncbi:MAG: acetyl-CoA carboxylase biotin carboxylase subunit [Crocinitomicaceae bacterium]|nr:acetyl-CoA carboxylase biotin carboxylase subunit [Crocinitomicaceae bacterium]